MDSLPSSNDALGLAAWEELGAGAPTVIAFARLCGQALISGATPAVELSPAARSILFAARHTGSIEVKGSYSQFEAPDRFLAICVELPEHASIAFKLREDPELTVRFLAGFRELCRAGLILHHLYRDFSLSAEGFDRARQVREDEVRAIIDRFEGSENVR